MSAYVVNNETITCIAKGFVEYGVSFRGGAPKDWMDEIIVDTNKEIKRIGQALLEANYKSVNFRYSEENEAPEFEPAELTEGFDEGKVIGCIVCFDYQACELDDWEDSIICKDLNRLEHQILDRLLRRSGMEVPYGYGGHNILED